MAWPRTSREKKSRKNMQATRTAYAPELMPQRDVDLKPRRKRLRVVEPDPVLKPAPRHAPKQKRHVSGAQTATQSRTALRSQTGAYRHAATRSQTVAHSQKALRVSPIYWVAVGVFFVATLFMLITNLLRYNELAQIQGEIREAEVEIESLRAEHDSMKMQLDPYLDPQRIQMLATHRLHMQKPAAQQQIVVSRDAAAYYYADEPSQTPRLAQSAP